MTQYSTVGMPTNFGWILEAKGEETEFSLHSFCIYSILGSPVSQDGVIWAVFTQIYTRIFIAL